MAVRQGAARSTRTPRRRPTPATAANPEAAALAGGGGQGAEVPKTNVDPTWSIAPWPVTVVTYNEEFEVEATTATAWLGLLFNPEHLDMYGVISTFLSEVEEFYLDNDLPMEELYELTLDLISTVSARPWWLALRIMYVIRDTWHIMGPQLMFHGVDPETVTLAAWLDAAMFLIMEHIKPDQATMFTLKLQEKPPESIIHPWRGIDSDTPPPDPFDDLAMDRGAFMAMMAG